jgi:hypothetical protein
MMGVSQDSFNSVMPVTPSNLPILLGSQSAVIHLSCAVARLFNSFNIQAPDASMFTYVLLLVSALVLPVANASAADLLEVRATAQANIYVNRDTLQVGGSRASAWSLWNFNSPKSNTFDESYRSVLIKNEYDCKRKTVRVVEVVEFAAPMAQGDALRTYSDYEHQEDELPPGSVGESIFEIACPNVSARKARFF